MQQAKSIILELKMGFHVTVGKCDPRHPGPTQRPSHFLAPGYVPTCTSDQGANETTSTPYLPISLLAGTSRLLVGSKVGTSRRL